MNEYADLRPNRALSTVYLEAMDKLDIQQYNNLDDPAPWLGSYSTDMGKPTFAFLSMKATDYPRQCDACLSRNPSLLLDPHR